MMARARLQLVLSVVLLFLLHPSPTIAKPKYIARLPNGAKVPGSFALGHVNANGTGALNAFGRHFIYSAREWSAILCAYDSDGDGQTNGQELGDPCCEWMPGDTPRYSEGVSHPGNKSDRANESLWRNIACPKVTKLWLAARSGSAVATRGLFQGVLLGCVFAVHWLLA